MERCQPLCHDWEVQATYFNCKRKYKTEEETLAKMRQVYQENIPTRNLHFIMGTMASHPKTFIMWDAALGCGPRRAIEAAGDVLASNLAGTVGSPDGMQ